MQSLLQQHGLRPQRALGQNFLVDGNVLRKLVQALEPGPEDWVLEIGPGLGVLTEALAGSARLVTAIEVDKGLLKPLAETLAGLDNVRLVHGDALKADFHGLWREAGAPASCKAAGNLPYYITTPLIFRLLEGEPAFSRLVLMVQREVAARLLAPPGGKDYGALAVMVAYQARVNLAAKVPAQAFWPRPEVESAIITVDRLPQPRISADKGELARVVKAAFGQRRKTLLNALAAGLDMDKEMAAAALAAAGIDSCRRGETLSLEEFGALAAGLKGERA